ncbi:unnamed protein product [Rhodiola kirilowii]
MIHQLEIWTEAMGFKYGYGKINESADVVKQCDVFDKPCEAIPLSRTWYTEELLNETRAHGKQHTY